jgi:hypothetical protein
VLDVSVPIRVKEKPASARRGGNDRGEIADEFPWIRQVSRKTVA